MHRVFADLHVFEQDFDSAMEIWRHQDDTVQKLCSIDPKLTRRRVNNTHNNHPLQMLSFGSNAINSTDAKSPSIDIDYKVTRKRKRYVSATTSESVGRIPPPMTIFQDEFVREVFVCDSDDSLSPITTKLIDKTQNQNQKLCIRDENAVLYLKNDSLVSKCTDLE